MKKHIPEQQPKYGILTYHDGFNFGAFLQAYSLQRTLDDLGFQSEIINFKSPYHWYWEYRVLLRTVLKRKLIVNLRRMMAFFRAHKKFRLSRFSFSPNGFSNHRYSCVVFGSDEIWNYTNPIVKLVPFYFGVGVPSARKISYAASCGNVLNDSAVPDVVSQGWRGFEHISVRDGNSKTLVGKYVDTKVELVVDPTFLVDFSGEEVECPHSDFILVYTTGFSPEVKQAVREFASKTGKRLISIGYNNDFCDQNVIGIGPFEFLGYYKAASMVVTSMFHGTIFSIKYHKPFAIIVDPYRINKLETMLERFELRDRLTDADGLAATLERPIDFVRVNQLVSKEVEHSLSFLRRVCADVQ